VQRGSFIHLAEGEGPGLRIASGHGSNKTHASGASEEGQRSLVLQVDLQIVSSDRARARVTSIPYSAYRIDSE